MQDFELNIRNLNLYKGTRKILHDISAHIPSKALTVLIGPNGAGKSSFLRCLAGLEVFESGDILIAGRHLKKLSQKERTQILGWSPAETRMMFSYTCLELVCMGRFPSHSGYPKTSDYEIARDALHVVGLLEKEDVPCGNLSSGLFRKLMIARVLASRNPVLLFDEPDAHLDIACAFEILEVFKKLTREGTTICISLHNLQLANQYADHLIALKAGEKMGEGSPSKIFATDLMSKAFGVGMTILGTRQGEQIFFHPLSQNLSEASINDKGAFLGSPFLVKDLPLAK